MAWPEVVSQHFPGYVEEIFPKSRVVASLQAKVYLYLYCIVILYTETNPPRNPLLMWFGVPCRKYSNIET
jgi:hypothetical protein